MTRHNRTLSAILPGLLALALLVTACGGGRPATTPTTNPDGTTPTSRPDITSPPLEGILRIPLVPDEVGRNSSVVVAGPDWACTMDSESVHGTGGQLWYAAVLRFVDAKGDLVRTVRPVCGPTGWHRILWVELPDQARGGLLFISEDWTQSGYGSDLPSPTGETFQPGKEDSILYSLYAADGEFLEGSSIEREPTTHVTEVVPDEAGGVFLVLGDYEGDGSVVTCIHLHTSGPLRLTVGPIQTLPEPAGLRISYWSLNLVPSGDGFYCLAWDEATEQGLGGLASLVRLDADLSIQWVHPLYPAEQDDSYRATSSAPWGLTTPVLLGPDGNRGVYLSLPEPRPILSDDEISQYDLELARARFRDAGTRVLRVTPDGTETELVRLEGPYGYVVSSLDALPDGGYSLVGSPAMDIGFPAPYISALYLMPYGPQEWLLLDADGQVTGREELMPANTGTRFHFRSCDVAGRTLAAFPTTFQDFEDPGFPTPAG